MNKSPTMYRLRAVTLLLAGFLVILTGCDSSSPDDGGNETPALSGTFGGTVEGTSDSVSVRIAISEGVDNPIGGKSIGGSGTLTVSGAVSTFDVSGSYVHPFLEMNLVFSDRPPGTISGNVSESRLTITGTINAPGVGGNVTLRKESA